MSIKDRIERNPFIYLLGVVIGVVSLTIAVDNYFWDQRIDLLKAEHRIEIAKHEERLASIERKLGSSGVIDVTSLVIQRTEQSRISSTSLFFPDWGFYASNDGSYWVHEEMRRFEAFIRSMNPEERYGFSEKVFENLRKSPAYLKTPVIHFWSAKNPSKVLVGPMRLLPYVSMERITISDYLAKEGLGDSYLGDLVDRVFIKSWMAMEEGYRKLSKLKKRSSKPLIENMEILSAQKHGNVFHVQGLITFNNVEVNGTIRPNYYQRTEFLFVSLPEHIFVINAAGLGEDPAPRGESYSKLTEWFLDFSILVDK